MIIRKMLVSMSAVVISATAVAQDATPPEVPAAQVAIVSPPAAPLAAKLKLREGTEIPLVFVDAISSATSGAGDRFNLRVEDNIKVDGVVVIPREAIAVGTVTSAAKRGKDIEIKPGTPITAFIDSDVELVPLP